MRRNSLEVGVLVVLNARGNQFFYGKSLTGYKQGIYKDVSSNERKGIVVEKSETNDNVKVAWNTTVVEYIYTWVSSRLLKKFE